MPATRIPAPDLTLKDSAEFSTTTRVYTVKQMASDQDDAVLEVFVSRLDRWRQKLATAGRVNHWRPDLLLAIAMLFLGQPVAGITTGLDWGKGVASILTYSVFPFIGAVMLTWYLFSAKKAVTDTSQVVKEVLDEIPTREGMTDKKVAE